MTMTRRPRSFAAVISSAVLLLVSAPAMAQVCTSAWSQSVFSGAGLTGTANASVVFDEDGSGPLGAVLFVGGDFTAAGGIPTLGIARWNGSTWSALSSQLGGGCLDVEALAVFDDDGAGPTQPALYAGGHITLAGGVAAFNLARWNGSTWTAAGVFAGGDVHALFVWDEDGAGAQPARLFAGGSFTTVNGIAVRGLARFDGSNWTDVGIASGNTNPFDAPVTAFCEWDPDGAGPAAPALAAAGHPFGTPASTAATVVAGWNGATWSIIGPSPMILGTCRAMLGYDYNSGAPNPRILLMGGAFQSVPPAGTFPVAYWNGATVVPTPVTPGYDFEARALALFDEDGAGPNPPSAFACGVVPGQAGHAGLARWTAGTLASPGGTTATLPSAPANAMSVFDEDGAGPATSKLVIAGSFGSAGPSLTAQGFAAWNGSAWSVPGRSISGSIRALLPFDDDGTGPLLTQMYVAGDFSVTTPDGTQATSLARWTGNAFAPACGSFSGAINALTRWDPDGAGPLRDRLVAVGPFAASACGNSANVAAWTGLAWSSLSGQVGGTSIPGLVFGAGQAPRAVCAWDPDGTGPQSERLVVGGDFSYAGGATGTGGIAIFDGTTWSTPGSGVAWASPGTAPAVVRAVIAFDDDATGPNPPALIVGGDFDRAGNTAASHIAMWRNGTWTALGAGTNGIVRALAIHDEDGAGPIPPALFAAGTFNAPALGVARWNGTAWSPVGAGIGSPGGPGGDVNSLAVLDEDGPLPGLGVLVAGGTFTQADGQAITNVTCWNSVGWGPFASGLASTPASSCSGPVSLNPAHVDAMATLPGDPTNAIPAALFAGGSFETAGGSPSSALARWSRTPARPLTLATFNGPGSLRISQSWCGPGQHYFTAFSLDPSNVTQPYLGSWGGMHIAFSDLLAQFGTSVAPFVGTLNLLGSATTVYPAGTFTSLAGTTLHAVTHIYDPVTVTVTAVSPVASYTL